MPPLPQQPAPSPPSLPPDDPFQKSWDSHPELQAPLPARRAAAPQQGPAVGTDPLRGILDPVQADKALKAQAWNAWHTSNSPEDFQKAFDALELPKETKAALWNLKFKPPISDAAGAEAAIKQSQAQFPAPKTQGPELGRFEGYNRIGQGLIDLFKSGTAPGMLFGPPTPQEQQQAEATKALIAGGPSTLGQQFAQIQEQPQKFMDPGAAFSLSEKAPFSPMAAGLTHPGTVTGGMGEAVAGLASPAGIAQLATLPASKLINMLYTGMMGKDTYDAIMQGHQLAAQGNQAGANEAYGQALVTGGMTLLTALGLRPGKAAVSEGEVRPGPRDTGAQAGITPGPQPSGQQVGPSQTPAIAQEGGPRPITSPGISGGRELGGDQPRATISAPIEGTGGTTGTVTPRPTGPNGQPSQPVGGVEASIKQALDIAKAAQAAGHMDLAARAQKLADSYRLEQGQTPTGGESQREMDIRRSGAYQGPERRGPSQVKLPEPMERRGPFAPGPPKQPPVGTPEVLAAEKARGQAAYKADPESFRERRGQEPTASQAALSKIKEIQGAQRPTGSAQAPTPASAQPPAQPLRPDRPDQEPVGTARQSLRPQPEPIREPVRAPEVAPAPAPEAKQIRIDTRSGKEYTIASPRAAEPGPYDRIIKRHPDGREEHVAQGPKATAALGPTIPAKEAAATLDRTLTRHLKVEGGRHEELARAIKAEIAKGPEARAAAEKAMSNRAQRAELTARYADRLLSKPTQEWDREMKDMLRAGAVAGEVDPETGAFMPALGPWQGEKGKRGGMRGKAEFKPDLEAVTREIYNNLRGNEMREVGQERRIELPPEAQSTLADQQRQYDALIKAVRAQEGSRPTDEQLAKLRDLMQGIHGLRQTRMIAEQGPGFEYGPKGELLSTGTGASGRFFNELMGRPRTSKLSKPSPELLKARLAELQKEALTARGVARLLREAKTSEVPARPEVAAPTPITQSKPKAVPEEVAKAPEKPVEPSKVSPKALGPEVDPDTLMRFIEDVPRIRETIPTGLMEALKAAHDRVPDSTAKDVLAKEVLEQIRKGDVTPQQAAARYGKGLQKLLESQKTLQAPKPEVFRSALPAPKAEVANPAPEAPKGLPASKFVEPKGPKLEAVRRELTREPAIASREAQPTKPADDRAKLTALKKSVVGKLAALAADDPSRTQLEGILKQIDAKLGPEVKIQPKPAAPVKTEPKPKTPGYKTGQTLDQALAETPESPRHPAQQLERLVGEERPKASPQAQARYEAEREKVVEQYAADRKAHQDKLKEIQALRSVDPKDYTPAFMDRMESYGRNLKDVEGQLDYTAKVNEARKAFERGDDRAGSAAVQSALAMADQRLIPPKVGKMPLEPSTPEALESSIEPRRASKAKAAEEVVGRLGEIVERLPEGEDRSNLERRLYGPTRPSVDPKTGKPIPEGLAPKLEDIAARVKMAMRTIGDMKARGETERTYTRKTDGAKVTETLKGLEARVRNLGTERKNLLEEEGASIAAMAKALEKPPVEGPPAEVPTKLEPTLAKTFGHVPRYDEKGRQIGMEAVRTGDKVVMPSPAPKERGMQERLDLLKQEEAALAGMQDKFGTSPTRGAAIAMSRAKKSIKALRASFGKDAPAPSPAVASTLYGTEMLSKAQRAESRPAREAEIIPAQAKGYVTGLVPPESMTGDHLLDGLQKRSEEIPRAILQAAQRLHDNTLEEARDQIAKPIMEQIQAKTLEPQQAAARYARALDVYNRALKTAEIKAAKTDAEKEALRAARDPRALAKAIEVARTGRIAPPVNPEAGFLGGRRSKPGEERAEKAIGRLFGKKAPAMQSKGPSLLERMRQTSDAFKASRMLDEGLEERRWQQQGMRQRFMQGLKDLPKVPGLQKFMYRGKESGREFQPEFQKVFDAHIRDWADLAEQRYHQLREAGHDVENYVPRVPIRKNTMWDRILKGTGQYTMGSILRQSANALKGRKFFRLEAPGLPSDTVVHVGDGGDLTLWHNGQPQSLGVTRQQMEADGAKFRTALSDDITRHSGQEYMQHLYIATATNAMNLDNAWRAHEFLEAYKSSPEFAQYATKAQPGDPIPDGFSHTKVPQLQGYAFEKHTAAVLDRYYNQLDKNSSNFLDKINYGLMSTIYWNPLKHTRNIIDHWATHHGLSTFLNPTQYKPMAKAFHKAWRAVIDGNDDYLYALDNGMPLRGRMVTNEQMTEAMLKEMNPMRMRKNASTGQYEFTPAAEGLAKAWGQVNPRRLYKSYMNAQRRALFGLDDILRLQATYHHQAISGDSFHASWREVGKHLPDYTLPTHVGLRVPFTDVDVPSSALAKGFGSKMVIFGRYHYGRLKSYGYMAEDIFSAKVPTRERLKAADRLFVPAVGMALYYTLGTMLAQKLTGRKDAEMSPSGATAVPWMIMRLLQGKSSISRTAMSTFTPNPLVDLAARMGYGELNKPKPIGEQIKETIGLKGDLRQPSRLKVGGGLLGEIGPLREAQQARKGIAGQADWAEMARRALLNVYVPKPRGGPGHTGPQMPHLPRMPR